MRDTTDFRRATPLQQQYLTLVCSQGSKVSPEDDNNRLHYTWVLEQRQSKHHVPYRIPVLSLRDRSVPFRPILDRSILENQNS